MFLNLFTPYSKGKENVLPRIQYEPEQMQIHM